MSFSKAQEAIPRDLFCQECGYNLRGLTSGRCPECGQALEAYRSAVPRLPWVYRAERGRMRAYWRTVWMVMFQHKRFCEEMARPVDYGAAQRFRWVTLLHVYLPILAGTLVFYGLTWPAPFGDADLNQVFTAVWPTAIIHVCVLVFLAAATGAPSYFFHPRDIPIEQQNRAIALSYYACAALAWTPLPFVIVLLGLGFIRLHDITGGVLLMLGTLLPLGQIAAWMADLIHVGVRVMPQRKGRLALLAVVLPFLWLGLAGLIFMAIPFLVIYFMLVFSSLW